MARSVRACLPGTGTVLSCFRAIRVPAGPGIRVFARVGLPSRTVATTGVGPELTRSGLTRTGLPRTVLARTRLPRAERPWSERFRSELLRAERARSVVARAVLARAGRARVLFLARPAPTVLRFAGAVGLPLPPSAWPVPRALPSGLARRPATGMHPAGRWAVEPV